LLLIGAAVFGAASVLAALSDSPAMLMAARAVLGIAGATLAPSTLSLIRHMFLDARERTFAIGVWITSFSAGAAIGPLVGGVLLERLWWGAAFLIALPVMAVLLIAGPLLLPEFRDPDAGRLDWPSAGLSMSSVLAVIYGIKQIAIGEPAAQGALPAAVGLVAGVLFVRRQRTLTSPFLDLRLFRRRAFSAAVVTNGLGFFVNFGALLFIAQYLQLVHGFSPWQAGLWTLPSAAGFIAGSLVVSRMVRRIPAATVMSGGLVVAALGFMSLSRIQDLGLTVLVIGAVSFSMGLAPVFTLATDLTVGAAPPRHAGAAAAVSETSSELGGALGIAILGSIGTAVYRRVMTAADVSPLGSAAAHAARDTLSGALRAAEQLGPDGDRVSSAARDAFLHGFEVTTLVSAGIATALALVVWVVLRNVQESPVKGECHG
jgi:DHA2 family multidrug resistance protein-like MFS transporter